METETYTLTSPAYTAVINQKVSNPGDWLDKFVFNGMPNGSYHLALGGCGGTNTAALQWGPIPGSSMPCERYIDKSVTTGELDVAVYVPTNGQAYVEYTIYLAPNP
jgi:hypothetical protein